MRIIAEWTTPKFSDARLESRYEGCEPLLQGPQHRFVVFIRSRSRGLAH